MANVSELYSRNLTNIGVDILKYILQEKVGFKNLQIQPEAKSTISPCSAGSKVVYMMEDKSGGIVIEATPDFYVRKVTLIIYIINGETESAGSEEPEVQLAIGELGSLIKLKRTKVGAVLFNRNLTATLFIGECEWEGDRGKVRFRHVERSSAYNLTHPNDLSTFANVLVAVVKECEDRSNVSHIHPSSSAL